MIARLSMTLKGTLSILGSLDMNSLLCVVEKRAPASGGDVGWSQRARRTTEKGFCESLLIWQLMRCD